MSQTHEHASSLRSLAVSLDCKCPPARLRTIAGTLESIAEELRDDADNMTPPIAQAIDAMEQHGGTFARKLAAAWRAADATNKAAIEEAFHTLISNYSQIEQ